MNLIIEQSISGKRVRLKDVSMRYVKSLIRQTEKEGYSRKTKHYSQFIADTRLKGGIAMVKETPSCFDTLAIYLD